MIVLKFMPVTALAAAAFIPTPHVLLEVIRYSSPNLRTRHGTHCHHCLRPLNTLLLPLAASNQQRVNLTDIKTVIIPVEAALKLP